MGMMMTLKEKRKLIGQWLRETDGDKLWDLMCGLRGPDSPSERDDMDSATRARAYAGRRSRKFKTVEVIRQKAFYGEMGGAARHHDDDHILLPPSAEWDHFDRHMDRAAKAVGLEIVIEERPQVRGRVEVKSE